MKKIHILQNRRNEKKTNLKKSENPKKKELKFYKFSNIWPLFIGGSNHEIIFCHVIPFEFVEFLYNLLTFMNDV